MTQTRALDEIRLSVLYRKLERPLFNVVYRWVWDREEASDVVQDAFLRVWNMRARVDATTVEPLLYKVALNLASNRRRRRKLWGMLPFSSDGREDVDRRAPADATLEAVQRQHAIRRAVEKLPEELRRVIFLCEFSGLSYDEIASTLEVPVGTIGSRRHRAMQLLRDALTEPSAGGNDAQRA